MGLLGLVPLFNGISGLALSKKTLRRREVQIRQARTGEAAEALQWQQTTQHSIGFKQFREKLVNINGPCVRTRGIRA